MKGTLKNLADMQSLPDEDFPYRKQVFIDLDILYFGEDLNKAFVI